MKRSTMNYLLSLLGLIFGGFSLISFGLFVFGKLSLFLMMPNPGWIPMLFGLLTIVSSITALIQIKKNHETRKTLAIWGLALGGLGLVLTAFYFWVLMPILMKAYDQILNQMGFITD